MPQSAAPSAWVEIDENAIRHNLRIVQQRAGAARVYVVCKGHGYGFDAVRVARLAQQEGLGAIACGDPADALRIREAGIAMPLMLYATTLAQALPAIAQHVVVVTAHDEPSLQVCLEHRLPFMLKLDSGFGRLGFTEADLPLLERAAAAHPQLRPAGAYTHLSDAREYATVSGQVASFRLMADRIERAGWSGLERMVASSRILLSHPDLVLDAVNPGRAIYGMLEAPYDAMIDCRPALVAVRARVIGLKRVRAGTLLGYSSTPVQRDTAVAVAAFGFANGYPRMPGGGFALVRGQRAGILGPRHTEHTILDVTELPGVAVGDVATFLGRDGDQEITAGELVESTGVPLIELVARMAAGSPVRAP